MGSKMSVASGDAEWRQARELSKAGDGVGALVQLRAAAEKGHGGAMQKLFKVLSKGKGGVPCDLEEAYRWAGMAVDVDAGLATWTAVWMLEAGFRFFHGDGVEMNAEMAVEWFRRAADKGVAVAMFNLGVSYANGYGVEKNAETAVEWYRRAVDKGDAMAMHNLGVFYANGFGLEKNAADAAMWRQRAESHGA